MLLTEATAIKQKVKKGWTAMAERGGVALMIVQMRALANKTAKKAIESAGKKTLEKSLFKGVMEQAGKSMTQKTVGKSIPIIGAVIGGLFDVAQMNIILEYADIFYHKRFILEKQARIDNLFEESTDIIDIEEIDIE